MFTTMSDHSALALIIPPSFPMDSNTTVSTQSTVQGETSLSSPLTYIPHDILTPQRPSQSNAHFTPDKAYPAPTPQKSPKWGMFRRSFAWTSPRRSKVHEDEAPSPKTLSTKSNQIEAFEMVETDRHDSHTAPKLPSLVNSLQSSVQVRKRKMQEPHPGRRVDVGDCDEASEGDDFAVEDEDDEWMIPVREYHLFLRSSRTAVTGWRSHVVGDAITTAGPAIGGVAVQGKGERVNHRLTNLQPFQDESPFQQGQSFQSPSFSLSSLTIHPQILTTSQPPSPPPPPLPPPQQQHPKHPPSPSPSH